MLFVTQGIQDYIWEKDTSDSGELSSHVLAGKIIMFENWSWDFQNWFIIYYIYNNTIEEL